MMSNQSNVITLYGTPSPLPSWICDDGFVEFYVGKDCVGISHVGQIYYLIGCYEYCPSTQDVKN